MAYYKRITLHLNVRDDYKLDFVCKKLNLKKKDIIKGLIDILFHELDPPFRDMEE